MLKFSNFIQTPMFEKWILNNASFFEGPKFLIGNLINKGFEFLLRPMIMIMI